MFSPSWSTTDAFLAAQGAPGLYWRLPRYLSMPGVRLTWPKTAPEVFPVGAGGPARGSRGDFVVDKAVGGFVEYSQEFLVPRKQCRARRRGAITVAIDRRRHIPEEHPIRRLFRSVTAMSFEQIDLHDHELMQYVADLLVEFVHIDNLYRVRDAQGRRLEYLADMLLELIEEGPKDERETRKHIGDYAMFIVGLYPESLTRRRRAISPEYYIAQGKAAYLTVAEIDQSKPTAPLFRKLSAHFEYCVTALNIEKTVLQDPFYQYVLRQYI